MDTTLGNALEFLKQFGFFNVVLPFLLIFTIVFGVLEKTKIFGVEGKDKLPKKNLNAMVAFVIAFFVVGASNIVEAIQASLPWVSLILVIIVAFLLLTGVFFGDEEYKLWDKMPGLAKFFVAFILIALLAIFLQIFGYLDFVLGIFGGGASSTFGSLFIFLLILAAVLWYLVGKKGEDK